MKDRLVSFMLRYQRFVYAAVLLFLIGIVGGPLLMRFIDRKVKYNWSTYNNSANPQSKEPFGAYYIDEYLRKSWKGKFEVDSTITHAMKKHSKERCNYLLYCAGGEFYDEEDTVKLYVKLLEKGSNFIFTNTLEIPALAVGVNISEEYTYFNLDDFNKENVELRKNVIGIRNSSGKDFAYSCAVWNNMVDSCLFYSPRKAKTNYLINDWNYTIPEAEAERTLVDSKGYCYAMTVRLGKGKALFDDNSCFFNNYAMGDSAIWKVNERLIKQTFDESLPLVVVYDNDLYDDDKSFSGEDLMFYVLLKNPATRLALYILLAMFVLWILMNSRRRRRAEEEVPVEHNSSIGYVEHLSTLYTANSDYKELLILEQRKLLYRFRKEFRFDIRTSGFTLLSEYAEIVAESKGYDKSEVKYALVKLESYTSAEGTVDCDSYKDCMKSLIEALQKKD